MQHVIWFLLLASLPFTSPYFTPSAFALVDEAACVQDVEAQYHNLNPNGSNLAARVDGVVPGRAFSQAAVAVFGYENHFQGIQRLHNKPYVVISGGDWWHRHGYVFVVKLGTKEGRGDRPFGSNVTKIMPPKRDRMVTRLAIGDSIHWHPGGLGSSGDIVAVTGEEFMKQNAGKIFFYDFTDPEHPVIFPKATIDRGTGKAGTVDLYKAADGHFVVFTYTGGVLYLYRSLTTSIADGFDVPGGTQVPISGGSTVNVVKQCDGKIFLLTMDNTANVAPIEKGLDQVYLNQLSFSGPGIQNPIIGPTETLNLNCEGYCNFGETIGARK